jgi:hypothetical protein
MANRDRDDDYFESDAGKRERRRKRKLPKSLLRLLMILAAIVVVVVVIVVAARSAIRSGEAADYQSYMATVADILDQSDTVGEQLVELLKNPGDTNRAQLQTQLDRFVAASEELEVKAKDLDAPKDLVDRGIHQIFLLVMSFRQMGVTALKPSLMSALEVQSTDVAAEQISRALYYLANSDFLYAEVFIPKATAVLMEKELTGVTVPTTQFLGDPDLASRAEVRDILAGLKSIGNLQAVHGVALRKVVALPDEKAITAGGTFNLTSSSDLAFVVTVENQGNMHEENVPVVITLLSPESTEPQKVTTKVAELDAKGSVTVTVTGLNPTPYGVVALLKVKVGPVQDEKYNDNNWIEANVIFKL